MKPLLRTGVLVSLALAAACSSNKPLPEPARSAWDDCRGQTLLAVRNQTGYEVEVYQTRTGSGGRMVIGTLPPGAFREFAVENEPGVGYGSRTVGGDETISSTSRPRVRDRHTVEMRYVCR